MVEERKSRRTYRVSGRVQGVGFRWWTRRRAQELSLAGAVRNLPDGSVQVDAEGEPDALRQLYDLLRAGPPAARVDQVEELDQPIGPLPTPFQIVS